MIGTTIRKLRKCRRISQIELARRVGVSQALISMAENNTRLLSTEILKCIAQEFSVDISELGEQSGSKGLEQLVRKLESLSQTQLDLIKNIVMQFNRNGADKKSSEFVDVNVLHHEPIQNMVVFMESEDRAVAAN